jgi:hypothetical protein
LSTAPDTTTTTVLAIDISTAPQTNGNSSNSTTLDAYQRSIDYFKASINTSANPCNDFYAYACSRFNSRGSSFSILNERNIEIQSQQMKNLSYNAPTVTTVYLP